MHTRLFIYNTTSTLQEQVKVLFEDAHASIEVCGVEDDVVALMEVFNPDLIVVFCYSLEEVDGSHLPRLMDFSETSTTIYIFCPAELRTPSSIDAV
ncbi:MAG: hypothetical protein EOP49_03845 [Sphingobacteriales bacterium]|nr:MAG: hypothetical protein EOP49_03845 [Sphingobacteriales bacterium]